MAGGAIPAIHGTADIERIEAPVTIKTYLMCAFAAFGGIFFGYDTGVCHAPILWFRVNFTDIGNCSGWVVS